MFYFTLAQLGVVGVLIIASLTDHCCHLIIKIKYTAINKILSEHYDEEKYCGKEGYSSGYNTESESYCRDTSSTNKQPNPDDINLRGMLKSHMIKYMSYGDVGMFSCGKLGLFLVNFFIAVNQFCFCVAYFIFIGNTIHTLFPLTSGCHNSTESNMTHSPLSTVMPITMNNLELDMGSSSLRETTATNDSCLEKSGGPPLMLLVACPLPIFLIFALIRSIRKMSWISFIANVSILGSCVVIFVYIFVGMYGCIHRKSVQGKVGSDRYIEKVMNNKKEWSNSSCSINVPIQ